MSAWDIIGNLGQDLFAQTGLGQDINGAYNMYNKAAGNPASQLIGQPSTQSSNPPPISPKTDLINKFLVNQQPQQSATGDSTNIASPQAGPTMPWMTPPASQKGVLGSLLKTAATLV